MDDMMRVAKALRAVDEVAPETSVVRLARFGPLVDGDVRKAAQWAGPATRGDLVALAKLRGAQHYDGARAASQDAGERLAWLEDNAALQRAYDKADADIEPTELVVKREEVLAKAIVAEYLDRLAVVEVRKEHILGELSWRDEGVARAVAYDKLIRSPHGAALYRLHEVCGTRTLAELDEANPALAARVRALL